MSDILNVEIKARCFDLGLKHKLLLDLGADYKGLDHQVDTYFNCPDGRLKLREGNIENSLIFYKRSNQAGPKESEITMTKLPLQVGIKEVLVRAYGVKIVVDKKRHIYFIDNVKFHLDELADLGTFAEIEAIDVDGSLGLDKLTEQCHNYLKVLKIRDEDLIEGSYSDLLS